DIEEYFDYDDEDANKRASSSGNEDSNIGVEVETSVRDLRVELCFIPPSLLFLI
ncbi:unnamed protein product, partial [Brassica rapa]